MSDKLKEICDQRRAHVAAAKLAMPIDDLMARTEAMPETRQFARRLTDQVLLKQPALIAEIKQASPSAGIIRADFDPAAHAMAYASAGATCLSVLTEPDYFMGEDSHLVAARAACALPVLRKDFTVDPYQVIEARAIGADAILLIMAALSNAQAQELLSTAQQYGLDVLAEVHDEAELERALLLDTPLIGINNRNLKTLKTDLAISFRLAALVPADRLCISESGIRSHADIQALSQKANIYSYLVGEHLLKQPDLVTATQELLGNA